MREVTPETVKDLKLAGEYGVLLRGIVPGSPAAKAGLKANDVVTELNGQRVEGAAQFQRMIREIPPGRTVQLTVWRDGKAQTISAVLGQNERRSRELIYREPGPAEPGDEFFFRMPRIMPPMSFPFFTGPRLGIDAEDLDGQLGNYFGAPGGEGVLVREVTAGSPAEKAGLKAGDVIIKLDGERVRTAGELREKLAQKHEQKSVALGVLRNRSEISVTVEPEQPREPKLPRELLDRNVSV
jgi:S1-C subfamily serine protease